MSLKFVFISEVDTEINFALYLPLPKKVSYKRPGRNFVMLYTLHGGVDFNDTFQWPPHNCIHILYTLDISRYNITRHCTRHNKFEGKILVRIGADERQPHLHLTGELWVSFVRKKDHDKSGVQDTESSQSSVHMYVMFTMVGVYSKYFSTSINHTSIYRSHTPATTRYI